MQPGVGIEAEKDLLVVLYGKIGAHDPADVLVDYEFKFQDGQLVIKQARPFLRASECDPGRTFEIEIADDFKACGAWKEYRGVADEYALKSRLHFHGGTIRLPVHAGQVGVKFIKAIEFGPERKILEPLNAGVFRFHSRNSNSTWYRWQFDQDFDLEGEVYRVTFDWEINVSDPATNVVRLAFDDAILSDFQAFFGEVEGVDVPANRTHRFRPAQNCVGR